MNINDKLNNITVSPEVSLSEYLEDQTLLIELWDGSCVVWNDNHRQKTEKYNSIEDYRNTIGTVKECFYEAYFEPSFEVKSKIIHALHDVKRVRIAEL